MAERGTREREREREREGDVKEESLLRIVYDLSPAGTIRFVSLRPAIPPDLT